MLESDEGLADKPEPAAEVQPSNDMRPDDIDAILNELMDQRLEKDTIGDNDEEETSDDDIDQNQWRIDDEDFLESLDIDVESKAEGYDPDDDEDLLPHQEIWQRKVSNDKMDDTESATEKQESPRKESLLPNSSPAKMSDLLNVDIGMELEVVDENTANARVAESTANKKENANADQDEDRPTQPSDKIEILFRNTSRIQNNFWN